MARAAASAALLNRELDSLSKDSVRTQRSFTNIERSSSGFGRATERTGSQIDRLSGRLRVLTDVATVLTPALSPIGGVIVPAISGLASQLGFAAVAGGTAVLAFQGIGDALKTLDKAALDPTRENLEAANLAMAKLSPSARRFASEIRGLIPEAQRLRGIAAEGMFPGVIEGLESLESVLPRVEQIVAAVSTELGSIAADTGASLASERWAPFLDFIAQEAPEALADMADAAGNVAHSMANLWMAFDPLNDDFSNWLVDATESLDEWSAGLSQTEGFQEFVAYIQENGPQVADTFGAIGNAVVQLVQATAPLGGPVLAGIEALADAFSAIADSDLGTPLFTAAAALALFNRTMAVTNASRSGLSGFGGRLTAAGAHTRTFGAAVKATRADLALMGTTAMTAGARTQREMARSAAAASRLRATLAPIGKGGALLGGLAIASTGAADKIGLTNTASLALMGTLAGPWGAAVGGAAGLMIDAAGATKEFRDALKGVDDVIKSGNLAAMEAKLADIRAQQKDLEDSTSVGDWFSDQLKQTRFRWQDSAGEDLEADIKRLKAAMTFTAETNRADADLNFLSQGFHATSTGLDSATQSAEDFKSSLDKINQVLTGRATFRDYQQALDDFADRAAKRAELQAKIVEAEAEAAAAGANDPALQRRIEKARERVENAKPGDARQSAQADLQALLSQTASTSSEAVERAREKVAALREELELYKNTLDTTTEAGRRQQDSLDKIAVEAVNYAKSIQDPALRTTFLDSARDQYIKAAEDAGMASDAARALADDVGLLNGVKGKVKITVDADGAIKVVSVLEEKLRKLSRILAQQRADNKPVPGDGKVFASGGWTGPGSKYQPAGVVHADEYVFSKEATNGNVAYLDQLHRQLRGYADGGLVRRSMPASPVSVSVSGGGLSSADVDRIAGALASARPVYGDVSIQPHNYNEFRRQMQQDYRDAGIGGLPR